MSISFQYSIYGRIIKSAILPPRPSLFSRTHCSYFDDGHTQRLRINGDVYSSFNSLIHDDKKDLPRWLWAQVRYAQLELTKGRSYVYKKHAFINYIRWNTFFSPLLVFFLFYFLKLGCLDGRRGLLRFAAILFRAPASYIYSR